MAERMLIKSNKPPILVVECENLVTLLAVAKVINESGLSAKVLMEYEVSEYGGKNDEKDKDVRK